MLSWALSFYSNILDDLTFFLCVLSVLFLELLYLRLHSVDAVVLWQHYLDLELPMKVPSRVMQTDPLIELSVHARKVKLDLFLFQSHIYFQNNFQTMLCLPALDLVKMLCTQDTTGKVGV